MDKLAWTYALNSNTVTVFVRHLLTAVFPLDTLLVSNLRGTKRTGAGDRLPLDKVKVNAIYSRFSATVLYNEDVLHYYASADKSLLSFCIFLFFSFVGATIERFPQTPLSTIGSAINAKITELRAKNKSVTP